MLERIWVSFFPTVRPKESGDPRRASRMRRSPRLESLEVRKLLAASLAPINPISVPAQMGYQVLLDGSGATGTDRQTFSVTSSNPDIGASIAQGPFFSVSVSHTAASVNDISFTGTLVMQLFQDLTPNTVSQIQTYVNDGYYIGKDFTRIANGFPGATDYVAQGGAPNSNGTGSSGQPGTPFANEIVQQLAFNNSQLVAMANAGGTTTNDTQFFLTTSTPTSLDYNYTIFGQLVSGQSILTDMTMVQLQANPITGENSFPVSPITITDAKLLNTDLNGVLHVDTTQAKAGETATITVTATDPNSGTTSTQTFNVTVGSYNGPTSPPINFRPFANPVTQDVTFGSATAVKLSGQSGNPTASSTEKLSYSLTTQPTHGTVSNFDSQTGTFTYTPNDGYLGTDSLQYKVTSTDPNKAPVTTSNPATVTLNVIPGETGALRVINRVLIVTPKPHKNPHFNNTIVVSQTSGANPVIQVTVNGVVDSNHPLVSSLDQIVVYGSKANDRITVDPSVTVPATLDGGHGGRNKLVAGSYNVREHGWFGHTTLVGGSGRNQLVGRKGQVRFKPTRTSSLIFAGIPHSRKPNGRPNPTGGVFYRFVHGRLVEVSSRP
jgi:cyclophilin family peptidyl-prolyl cis-trans isomerase